MVRHIVLFQFNREFSTEILEKVGAEFKHDIESLVGQIAVLRSVHVAFNINPEEKWDICLNGEFETLEDIKTYSIDPRHVAAASKIKKYLAGRSCVDYEF